jgi:predicted phosphodiesterase
VKIAVLSDIHANTNALKAVYEDAVDQDVDRFWFLGDAVGYGPDPVTAVRWLTHFVEPEDWVLGNHEAIMANLLTREESEAVSPAAREMCDLHWQQLMADEVLSIFCQIELNDLRRQPRIHSIGNMDHILTHAGQHQRHIFRYIYPWHVDIYLPLELEWLKERRRQQHKSQIQWYGHSHVPTLVYGYPHGDAVRLDAVPIVACQKYSLTSAPLVMINPGSVGQPRDRDQRAAYAIIDTEYQELTFRRIVYPWRQTLYELEELSLSSDTFKNLEKRLRDAGLPGEVPQEWERHYQKARGIGCGDEL